MIIVLYTSSTHSLWELQDESHFKDGSTPFKLPLLALFLLFVFVYFGNAYIGLIQHSTLASINDSYILETDRMKTEQPKETR